MSPNPEHAADALRVVADRQAQVIGLAPVPAWYWSVVGALMIVLAVGVDVRTPVAVGVTACVFVCGLLASTAWIVRRVARTAKPHHALLGSRGPLAIVLFIAAIDAPTFAVAALFKAAGFHYPATTACVVAGVLLAIGGPVLMRHLGRVMLAGRVGS